jgi:Meiotically Up-regulated Gene 113 (MUG113) protein
MIYFAQLPTGAIKIGKADDVEHRLDQLRRHYGNDLALLATMPGEGQEERALHKRFAHLRIDNRREKEQFRPGPDLMQFIGKPLLVSANPEAVPIALPRSGDGAPARIAPDLASKARLIVGDRGVDLSEYLSEILRPRITKDYAAMIRKLEGGSK